MIYMQLKDFENAKLRYLSAAAKSPSALSWQGVGAACYNLGALEDAEEAFAELALAPPLYEPTSSHLGLLTIHRTVLLSES